MNEVRVIALAGVFQSAALARSMATKGTHDAAALESSIASILRLDVETPAEVFGGIPGVRFGLETLVRQIDERERDMGITQIAVAVLRLERSLARRPAMLDALREALASVQRQVDHLGITHTTVLARLSEIYASTLSTLRPRVVVQGNPLYLTQPPQVERIRATLLAGIRAAVLWRQVGGTHWRLLLRRRQCAMLARGLLARCTFDAG
ncbi:MAG: high frequency lysogenization protein HflD [Tahibacter sp.]